MLLNDPKWNESSVLAPNDKTFRQTQYLRPVLDQIHHNPAAEIMCHARGRTGILSLGQGEGDVSTPDFITEAGIDALRAGKTFYGPPLGLPEMRRTLSDYYRDVFGFDLPPERMVLTPSGTAAMHLAMMAVCDKDDEVIAVTPLWKNLLCAIQLQEAHTKEVCLRENGGSWSLDLQELFDAVTPITRAIIINSPNNPTGWMMDTDDMRTIMEFARERGIWVISDEVYGRMAYGIRRAPSFLDVADPDDRLIVINSFSKNWAMTGWRMGWMVVPEEAEKRIYDLVLYDYLCPQAFSQFAGMQALRNGEAFLSSQMAWYRQARDIVYDRFAQWGNIVSTPPDATFYAFFRVEGEESCFNLCRRLIDEAGLCLAPGCAFGKEACGYVRMCFAVSEPKLLDALGRLERVVRR
ncbi:MAG: aminotransferase class I/II-fold pyridoxal phosphate-dependent enzyme [Alphaproteobacteria bacterium]|nr:aminotransferase class I/II-fold pyridoxal phosphate-dependent enzyme [Alphaproteobacteria bacterium]